MTRASVIVVLLTAAVCVSSIQALAVRRDVNEMNGPDNQALPSKNLSHESSNPSHDTSTSPVTDQVDEDRDLDKYEDDLFKEFNVYAPAEKPKEDSELGYLDDILQEMNRTHEYDYERSQQRIVPSKDEHVSPDEHGRSANGYRRGSRLMRLYRAVTNNQNGQINLLSVKLVLCSVTLLLTFNLF